MNEKNTEQELPQPDQSSLRKGNGERSGPIFAQALLKELSIKHGSVHDVAAALGLELREVEADGFDGALIRARSAPLGAIAVRASIREASRKNFTIAHEIGHFVLPGHECASVACTASEVGDWAEGLAGKALEREANEFAAELLMPAELVKAIARKAAPSLEVIERIARDLGASLSAAAWRYCDVTEEKCAVLWSTDGAVRWARRSSGFPFFLPAGWAIAEDTFASACFNADKVPNRPERVPAHLWVSSPDVKEDSVLWEQSKALPSYRSVISLLWSRDTAFPPTIEVKVSTLDYGPHTRTFGWVFDFRFGANARRHYTLRIGGGDRITRERDYLFHLPLEFANLSRLEQAKSLVREYKRAREAKAPDGPFDSPNLDVLYSLYEDSIAESDIDCDDFLS